ncbi:VOC family protein [Halomarina halobia]|uniref:VOC family protein n=1 Tax=Halomarina halobia TaxID=3033386 RepID=A0ABD6AE33_9EURY|nr:VOC family protein [Halomarina sp. PSR21]
MRVIGIDRVVIATDSVERTAETLDDRLGIGFGDLLTLTTETSGGENTLNSVIDTAGIGVDIVQPDPKDDDNAIANFVEEHGTGLYAIAFRVADLETARADLATDGIEPVGEITVGEFTELLYHPHDFDGLFVFLAEFPHAFETASRMEALGGEDR